MTLTNETTSQSQTISLNDIGEATTTQVLSFSELGVSISVSGASADTGMLVNALDGGSVVTKQVATQYATESQVEVIVEEEQDIVVVVATADEAAYLAAVDAEYEVMVVAENPREYDTVATVQATPVTREADPLAAFRELDRTLSKELAEVGERRDALQAQIDELSAGTPTDAEGARALVGAAAQNAFGFLDAHASLTGSVVSALLVESGGPREPSKPAAKPATAEPDAPKSP